MTGLVSSIRRSMPAIVSAALVVSTVVVVAARQDTRVLSSEVSITQFPSGVAMVQVPYRRDGLPSILQIAVDMNTDSVFSDDEVVIRAIPITPEKYWNANVFFRPSQHLTGSVRMRLTMNDEVVTRSVRVIESHDTIDASEFADAARPRDALMAARMPDMDGGAGECGPIAFANAFSLLAKLHEEDGRLPSDAAVMLDELKTEMRWTRTDGVYAEDAVMGANRWTQKKGLPIRTTAIESGSGSTALDALERATTTDGTAQLRLLFAVPAGKTSRVIGGHLVTLAGVSKNAGRTYIEVHDSRSPNGTDIYEVRNNSIDYAFFSGTTTLNGGFIQTWVETRVH